MKNGDNSFCHESLQDRETIADILSSLQQGLSNGTLKFSDEDNEITLKPSGLLSLTVKASSNSDHNVLDVRVSWTSKKPKKLKKELRISVD
jgi:amphi-Trp domain-containing protein